MSSELQLSNLIDGELCSARSGRNLPVFEPATGEVFARAPDSGPSDVSDAVAAAERAAPAWGALPAETRAGMLERLRGR